MKAIIAVMFLLVSTSLLAEDGPKVYINSVSTARPSFGLFPNGVMPAAPIIEAGMAPHCSGCQFIQKKENADYVVTFWAVNTETNWSVATTKDDGKVIAFKKGVIKRKNGYKDAAQALLADWNQSK
jgi:hypothetical protein